MFQNAGPFQAIGKLGSFVIKAGSNLKISVWSQVFLNLLYVK